MKEFLKYFLGEGETIEFKNFTVAHLVPILIAAGVVVLIYFLRNHLREAKIDKTLRYIMAFTLIFSEMSYYWRLVALPSLGPTPLSHLPITVCGWVVVFSSYMLIGKSQTLFDICYFWLFSGTIFALITPTVISFTGPTRFRFYQFWLEHLMGYIAVFYMIFVHRMRPTIKSMIKAYGALVFLAVIAYAVNDMLGAGANYLFLARPEDTPSVLDVLPPVFALRIAVMVGVVTLMFLLSYLPWFIKDKKQGNVINKKDQQNEAY